MTEEERCDFRRRVPGGLGSMGYRVAGCERPHGHAGPHRVAVGGCLIGKTEDVPRGTPSTPEPPGWHGEETPTLEGEGEEAPTLEGEGEPCPMPDCEGGILTTKRGRFGPFLGCSRYPDCTYIRRDGPPPPEQLPFEAVCPKHADGTLVARRARRTGNVFWGCSAYPKCDFTTNDEPTGALHEAHQNGLGAVARRGDAGVCLTCGEAVELPAVVTPGMRLPGGPANPAAVERPARRGKRRAPTGAGSGSTPPEPKVPWGCPQHRDADVVILTSRKGRVYGACRLCEEFEDGLTPERRAQEQLDAERLRSERLEAERLEAERLEAERQAQLLADRRAPTCAHCGRIERVHFGETHPFAGGALAHATSGLIQAAMVVGVIAALWLFWVSATTPGAPLHSLTGPLLCVWDWKGTVCQ